MAWFLRAFQADTAEKGCLLAVIVYGWQPVQLRRVPQ